ncbi:unnamed protein product [Thlaspi arvense]|uniref:Uncharacterized protein n=1 Tax=Thlaspi arvense TaxID=13288 RepID=A0AAU9RBR8_THLAR|nr:unnamed protein product [Thlaspi arvense]
MKSATLLMISCFLMFIILHHMKEVEAAPQQTKGVCELADQFPGKCGKEGSNVCINEMQKKEPEQKLRCQCFDHPTVILAWKKHICKCRYDC